MLADFNPTPHNIEMLLISVACLILLATFAICLEKLDGKK